ncbi:ABC transporter permease [Bacteroidales bacterium OttesenSCG-928-C19]|nr:ABC transporter permease [Bacteroidales bacterium OttesenSCG-928-C19]
MFNFILKRLFYGFLVLLGVITIVFFLFNILPGDPARMMLGQRADQASIEIINRDLGLDKPLYQQFFNYLNDLSPVSVHNSQDEKSFWYLDAEKYAPYTSLIKTKNNTVVLKKPYLRRSYQSKRNVSEILSDAFPKTAILALASIAIALILGIFIGTLSAIYKDTFFDKSALFISVLGMALPSFFAAILIAWFFAYVLSDYTGLNMFGTLYSVDDFGRGEYLDLKNLILPAITLGIRPLAVFIELTKTSMLDVFSQDYIRTAKAKGLRFGTIVWKHALRNGLNPIVTSATGWLASLMAGAVFVEYVFDWKGVGSVIIDALEKYDFPVIMGSLLVISIILVLINILVDILYGILDPRVRIK